MADPLPLKTFLNLPFAKQEKIIQAAVDEFGEKGYQGASINTMVKNLGIAKGSIYQYFEDKRSLFFYVFTHSMDRVKQYLKKVRDNTRDQPLGLRLEQTLHAGVCFIEEYPSVYRLYVTFLNDDSMPMRHELLTILRRHSLEYIASLLEQARDLGELKQDTDVFKAAFVIDAVMDRFLLTRTKAYAACESGIYNADRTAIAQWVERIVTMICKGIIHDSREP